MEPLDDDASNSNHFLTPGRLSESQSFASHDPKQSAAAARQFNTGNHGWDGLEKSKPGKELKHAINFRRTYFFFINLITVLFLKQGAPDF